MSNETMDDELVSQFMSFTGSADATRAASYLEMSGGDLQTAVSLYMEHETGNEGTSGGGGGGNFGAASMGGGGGAEDAIRAPDATRTMRLMDDIPGMMAGGGGMGGLMHGHAGMDPSMQLMNAMMEEQFAQSAFGSAFNNSGGRVDPRAAINAAAAAGLDDDDEDDDSYHMAQVDDDDDDEVQVVAPPEPPRLSDMFAAPTHLIHRTGGFNGARAMAKDSKRWLLVNVQSDKEFSSHALNRDVWRDELVENLIREGFIFWQTMDDNPDGRTFCERYQVHVFPHISIIDPRTGRLMWRKEGWTQQNPVTVEFFAEMAMDFCSRNSFDRAPQAPRQAAAAGVRPAPQKRSMNEMSEDEQLEAAMRASIEDAVGGGDDGSSAAEEKVMEIDEEDSKPAAVEESKPSMTDELLAMNVPAEPAKGARIQFRMPDGKKVVRSFDESDSVKTIYAFIAVSPFLCRIFHPLRSECC
ncbi:hypothetical protein MPSEU_000089900 [Mayamaea pseudoterrestris]|nr:hypothetical protein MPSEU_000089900 [Mayamaea pseudoterrestris]